MFVSGTQRYRGLPEAEALAAAPAESVPGRCGTTYSDRTAWFEFRRNKRRAHCSGIHLVVPGREPAPLVRLPAAPAVQIAATGWM
jgi:hypothetical protein